MDSQGENSFTTLLYRSAEKRSDLHGARSWLPIFIYFQESYCIFEKCRSMLFFSRGKPFNLIKTNQVTSMSIDEVKLVGDSPCFNTIKLDRKKPNWMAVPHAWLWASLPTWRICSFQVPHCLSPLIATFIAGSKYLGLLQHQNTEQV